MKRPTALLIPSPWSGDEYDPIPWTYRPWYRLYRTTRQVRHLIGLHDFRPRLDHRYCDWCGAVKR